jgi:hypothetical protein
MIIPLFSKLSKALLQFFLRKEIPLIGEEKDAFRPDSV